MRTTAYLKAIKEVYGKTITGLGPKEEYQAVMLDILVAMYVTLLYVLMHCFDFSKSNNDFSFQKVLFFKTKIIKTAEKEPY